MWNNSKSQGYYAPANPLFEDDGRIDQPVNVTSYKLAKRDETEVLSEAKIRLIYGLDDCKIIKYLSTELDITSDDAETRLNKLKKEVKAEFSKYIASCIEDNIMVLKAMLTKSLEKNDLRSAVEIMKTLDSMTMRYMENNGLIEHKVLENEIEINFS